MLHITNFHIGGKITSKHNYGDDHVKCSNLTHHSQT